MGKQAVSHRSNGICRCFHEKSGAFPFAMRRAVAFENATVALSLREAKFYDHACLRQVDSWALGVLLYTLVYGTMPFDGGDHKNLIRQISNGEYKEPTQSSGNPEPSPGIPK